MSTLIKVIFSLGAGALCVKIYQFIIEHEHGRRWAPGMPSASVGEALLKRLADEVWSVEIGHEWEGGV